MDSEQGEKFEVGQLVLANEPLDDEWFWPAIVESIDAVGGRSKSKSRRSDGKIRVQFLGFSNSFSNLDVECIQKYDLEKVRSLQEEYNTYKYNEAFAAAESYRKEKEPKCNGEKPSRCQQPDVFVNAHLNKIKLESDFVKEEKEKDGTTQSKFKDVGQGKRKKKTGHKKKSKTTRDDSSSDVHNSSKTKGKAFSASSSFRQQKQVLEINEIVIKEEPLDEENSNFGPNLATVNSLSREKINAEMDLKKEIQRLNLIVKEQQIQIQDLNSTITQQKEENSRLKQQQNPDPVQIGELPKKVLSRVLNYLDINSLKNSRLVCRLWRNEGGKILLKNFYLVCDDKEKCDNALINFQKSSSCSFPASKSIPQKLWSKNAEKTLDLLRKFENLEYSITELKFSSKRSDDENLFKILGLLPNLKVLETEKLDLSPALNPPIEKLKTLRELKLNFKMEEETSKHFLDQSQRFASIQSLEIHTEMNFIWKFVYPNRVANLKITRCTLDVKKDYDPWEIRYFLTRISRSLKHLKLVVSYNMFDSERRYSWLYQLIPSLRECEPWSDDWMIPIGLDRVETVEIVFVRQAMSGSLHNFMLNSTTAALRLPQLKKLALGFIPEGLEKTIQQWNSHESAEGRKLSSKSLEELEKLFCLETSHCKIPGHPWPGLKSLKYYWNDTFDTSLLRELTNLERLELIIKFNLNPVNYMKYETEENQSSSKFQVKDLKNLKSLSLTVPGDMLIYQVYATRLFQKDLKFMKNLQSVEFCGVDIDPEPLKAALGPNVSVVVTK